jgi:hypothetical protein
MSEKTKDSGKEQKGIDPEKFFNEEEYNTIKIGSEAETKKESDAAKDLLTLLASKTIGEKDIALDLLKKEKAVTVLVDAVKNCKNPKNKALLVAACWESGMDFKAHLDFFAELVHDSDLFVSLEAITVLSENIGSIDKKQSLELINTLNKAAEDHFNAALIQDVIESLKSHL